MTKRKRFLSTEEIDEAVAQAQAVARQTQSTVVLLGGAAMAVYGSPRMTVDVDVVVDAMPLSIEQAGGKPLSFGGRQWTAPNGARVDWIQRSDEYAPLYAEAIRMAHHVEDCTCLVVRPEYLAAIKLAAGRPKDRKDLRWLLAQEGLVDRDVARRVVGKFLGGRFARDEFDQEARLADIGFDVEEE